MPRSTINIQENEYWELDYANGTLHFCPPLNVTTQPQWPLPLEIPSEQFRELWGSLCERKLDHPEYVHTFRVSTNFEDHLYVEDILEILNIFPNLSVLDLNAVQLRLRYTEELSPSIKNLEKRFSLDRLRVYHNNASYELYPFLVANVLHLFEEIDELVLIDMPSMSISPMSPASDPLPERMTPNFPSHLIVNKLSIQPSPSAVLFERLAGAPFASTLKALDLNVQRTAQLPVVRNLLRACTNLENLTLRLYHFDEPMVSGEVVKPPRLNEPIEAFLDLSSCTSLKVLTLDVCHFDEKGNSDSDEIMSRVISSLSSSAVSITTTTKLLTY